MLPGVGGAVVSVLAVVAVPEEVSTVPVVVVSAVVAGVELLVSEPVVEAPVTDPVVDDGVVEVVSPVEPDEEVVVVEATHDGVPAESNVHVSELWQQVIELMPEVIPPQQVVLAGHTFHSFGDG